jgi:hypothetical protein
MSKFHVWEFVLVSCKLKKSWFFHFDSAISEYVLMLNFKNTHHPCDVGCSFSPRFHGRDFTDADYLKLAHGSRLNLPLLFEALHDVAFNSTAAGVSTPGNTLEDTKWCIRASV